MDVNGNYLIEPVKVVGKGASGYVEKIKLYNSNHHFCGYYARKTFSPDPKVLKQVNEDELKERFIREILCQAKLNDNNIIPIYLFNKRVDNPYFIMEWAENDLSLDIDNKKLSDIEKVNIAKDIFKGLNSIHKKGLYHRDIKPQNILKCHDGNYKISDFGLVKNTVNKKTELELTAINQIMGSGMYIAPEIMTDCDYSPQSDIFAAAVIVNQLKISDKKYKGIFSKCLNYSKEERYKSANDVLIALDEC